MRRYTEEVVTRYRNSPAIWGWEFANEMSLSVDLPNAQSQHAARKAIPHLGVPAPNRHLMQGHLDPAYVKWDDRGLTGKAKVVAGEPCRIVIALNGRQPGNLQPSEDGRLAVLTLEQATNQIVEWGVNF